MSRVRSFEPIIGHRPRVIILGSMPGVASLEAVQYYAHPRNAFWPIMAELFGIDRGASYERRIAAVEKLPLILWDTLQACHRPGSLDSAIDAGSVRANDFPGLLTRYPQIRAIFFNGATSEKYFRQLVFTELPSPSEIDLVRLPSTSPAHAGMRLEQKLAAWRQILDYLE
ncbi:MAG: DNA-deoxyinosine glycosylase [Gammaproteobacteria bacterium]|nr:DNA-deoxyinosine glycosylase [Gammaproteobacteria bacterium]MDH3535888.1 DNA-deoxyinosine glycosylase [Gammaproteobacteria bacterium]